MAKEYINILAVQKDDKSERWLFLYDETEILIAHLYELMEDTECSLSYSELELLMERAFELEENNPLNP